MQQTGSLPTSTPSPLTSAARISSFSAVRRILKIGLQFSNIKVGNRVRLTLYSNTWRARAAVPAAGLVPSIFHKNARAQCVRYNRTSSMTTAQKAAAKNNIKKAAAAAKKKKTIVHLPKATRTALGKKGAEAAKKKSSARK